MKKTLKSVRGDHMREGRIKEEAERFVKDIDEIVRKMIKGKQNRMNYKQFILIKKETKHEFKMKIVDFFQKAAKRERVYMELRYKKDEELFVDNDILVVIKEKEQKIKMSKIRGLENMLETVKERYMARKEKDENVLTRYEENIKEEEKEIYTDLMVLMNIVNILKTPALHAKLMKIIDVFEEQKDEFGEIKNIDRMKKEIEEIKKEWIEKN